MLVDKKVRSFVDFFKINEYNNWTTQAFWNRTVKLLLAKISSLNFDIQAWWYIHVGLYSRNIRHCERNEDKLNIKIVNWSIKDWSFRCVLKSFVKDDLVALNEKSRSCSNLAARDSKLEATESDKVLKQ
jgi:hypothetical protein